MGQYRLLKSLCTSMDLTLLLCQRSFGFLESIYIWALRSVPLIFCLVLHYSILCWLLQCIWNLLCSPVWPWTSYPSISTFWVLELGALATSCYIRHQVLNMGLCACQASAPPTELYSNPKALHALKSCNVAPPTLFTFHFIQALLDLLLSHINFRIWFILFYSF